jgi:tripartite-type tricarboxylate transporter receptor subunit TctC
LSSSCLPTGGPIVKAFLRAAAGVFALAAGLIVHAQPYPNKPIRVVVGYPPGGGTDLASRLVAAALSELWGVIALVDNRTGAGGAIGTEITVKAAPDGYTIMLCTIGSHAITPARTKLPYDHIRDFAFISMIGSTPNVLLAHPSQPMKNVGDVVAYAKANPGKLSYGSSGVGASPHLSIELLKSMTGINIVHVPYKGAAPALADVMGGQMPLSVGNLPGGPLAAIKSGRLRGVGITTAARNPRAPDVPTFAEGGVAGYDVASWYGICAPAGVPKPILAKLNAGLVTILNSPELRQRMEDQGIDVTPSTPGQFLAHVKAETLKWAQVVRDAGLAAE